MNIKQDISVTSNCLLKILKENIEEEKIELKKIMKNFLNFTESSNFININKIEHRDICDKDRKLSELRKQYKYFDEETLKELIDGLKKNITIKSNEKPRNKEVFSGVWAYHMPFLKTAKSCSCGYLLSDKGDLTSNLIINYRIKKINQIEVFDYNIIPFVKIEANPDFDKFNSVYDNTKATSALNVFINMNQVNISNNNSNVAINSSDITQNKK